MRVLLATCCLLLASPRYSPAAGPLPLGKIPPGKVFLVVLPHHDDHTWEYGFAGLITKLVDAGYTGYYVRVSNDEKDGSLGWPQNDMVNYRECLEAVRYLGMKDVISLNWRNDHSDSVPHNEIRAQLILLIRRLRPEVILTYDPWGHYDRNPDHRKTARAVAEASWAAGYPNFQPEHGKLGLEPYRVRYRYYSQRSDYGMGYTPNIAFELNPSQMERKAKAYWMNRNVRLQPSMARAVRAELAQNKLRAPELDGLDDEEAAKRLQEWRMYWISEKRGKENGVKYAEVFYFVDELDDLPGLQDFAAPSAGSAAPLPPAASHRPQAGNQVVLVVTAHAGDYLLWAGGALAGMIGQGATVYVIRVTNDEKEAHGLAPEQAALHNASESEEAARILGVKEVISLGYRSGELAAVSPTELRDRLIFYIRHYRPRALFLPDPYTHYDDNLDHYYAGSAAEEARWAAGIRNFEPPFALAGLSTHQTPELYYYAPPVDPRRREAETTAAFAPQPVAVDIAASIDRKLRAIQALRTTNHSLAIEVRQRLAAAGRRLPLLEAVNDDSVKRLTDVRIRNLARDAARATNLSLAEEFHYIGREQHP